MEQAIMTLVGVIVGGLISFFLAWQNVRWNTQQEVRTEQRKQRENFLREIETLYSQILFLLKTALVEKSSKLIHETGKDFNAPVERLELRASTEIYNQYIETGKALEKLVLLFERVNETKDPEMNAKLSNKYDEASDIYDKQYSTLVAKMKEHLNFLYNETMYKS